MTDPITQSMIQGAAGAAGGAGEYIDNLFAAHFYTGVPGGSATVNNGIDLSGSNEGMVWVKNRYATSLQLLYDTIRGGGNAIYPDRSDTQGSQSDGPATFTSNGFTTGSAPSSSHISWTFKSETGFFDVVTYTGNGSNRAIDHNLGSVPGAVLIKNLTASQNWVMYHRSIGNTKALLLDDTGGTTTASSYWNNTSPTASNFTVGTDNMMNGNGNNYVAYIFAHDAAKFGVDGNNSVIKCDSYTGNGSSNGPDINLGWEPQWLLIKRSNSSEDWMLFDHMRTSARQDMWLDDMRPNTTGGDGDGAGSDSQPYLNWTSTGFKLSSNTGHTNGNGDNYIYIAIRRYDGLVGKPAEAGTDVFAIDAPNSNSVGPIMESGFPVDFAFLKHVVAGTGDWYLSARLMDGQFLKTNDSSQASTYGNFPFDYQNGWVSHSSYNVYHSWMWKRHAGFDVVAYKGSGSADYVYHSLGKIPEMIWVKKRSGSSDWRVYHKGLGVSNDPFDFSIKLNYYAAQVDDATVWNDAAPEINRFTVGTHTDVNASGSNYIAMLFRSVTGISKVGSYTGSTYDVTVSDVGFSPRFLFVKNITTGGSAAVSQWNMVDTVRGFTSGNDSRLWLNSGSGPNNYNYAYPTSSGFVVTEADWKENGSTYIYYAHA